MASYILRDIDPDLWKRVKAKAAMQGEKGTTLKKIVEQLLTEWVKGAK
jgi:transcriptional regulator